VFLGRITSNLDAILDALRSAAPEAEIITFTNYSVFPAFEPLTRGLNLAVASAAAAHGVRVAGVTDLFILSTICYLTLFCAPFDSHPSSAGHTVVAEELWGASEYDRLGN
jgi:hypothetical protein